MAFRISRINEQGHRLDSALIEKQQAVISSESSADLRADFPEKTQITIVEEVQNFKISVRGTFTINGRTLSNITCRQAVSCEFSCNGQTFYLTRTHDGKVAKRKKGYLTMLAATLIWVLLITQLSVPVVIPFSITSHEKKGRNALLETCVTELDSLRKKMRNSTKEMQNASQLQRDMLKSLSSEVEQIIWTFRNGADFMSQQELEILDAHIKEYARVTAELSKGNAAQASPLAIDPILKAVLPQK